MDNKTVDLHVHSTRSDGTYTPTELVDYSMEKGLAAFALTDHDTVAGLEEAIGYAASLRCKGMPAPEIIPGIELSTEYHGKDIHIVGLFIDYHQKSFLKKLDEFVNSRIRRNQKMCALLREAGIGITYEQLLAQFPDGVITRVHYARYLLAHGYIKTLNEAFERYIGDDCPYFIPREKVTPAQAIRLIQDAEGIPVLAHPIVYRMEDRQLDALVMELKAAGLMGIEAVYSTHTQAQERQVRGLAAKHHLLISGGSDFHGGAKPELDLGSGYGNLYVPEELLNRIRKSRHSKLLFTDLDGTLLNDESSISTIMKTALDQAIERGHQVIPASGRPLLSILKLREELALTYPGMLVIAFNGAMVYDCDLGESLIEHCLSEEEVRYIDAEAAKFGIHVQGFSATNIVCREQNEEIAFYTRRIDLPVIYTEDIAAELASGTFKMTAVHLTDPSRLEAFRNHLADYCNGRIQLLFSSDKYLEIFSASTGKGEALNFIREHLHILPSHTYAAGDMENDISMLEAAHTAIALSNALPAVKAAADIVTSQDNNHDGLAEILKKQFL